MYYFFLTIWENLFPAVIRNNRTYDPTTLGAIYMRLKTLATVGHIYHFLCL
jgi:hypothetical protein